MFNFKRASWIFLLVLLILGVVDLSSGTWHGYAYAIAFTSFFALNAFGSAFIESQFFIPAVCKLPDDRERRIAITFDDGPDATVTPQVLSILEQYDVKAAFFCIGQKIAYNPLIVKQINDKGHLLGNHSYSHSPVFDFFPAGKVRAELRQTIHLIYDICGRAPRLFRPPYGVTNPAIAKAISAEQLQVVGWNIRSLDGIRTDKDIIFNRIAKKLQPGSILLLHDTNTTMPELLPVLIEYLLQQQYKIVRLDELIGIAPYKSGPTAKRPEKKAT